MPYKTIDDLHERVRKALPKGAQKIFLEAFNHAWNQYRDAKDRDDLSSTREETAHKIAWAAVKRKYEKDSEDKWVKID